MSPDIVMGSNQHFIEVHESNDYKLTYSVGKVDQQSLMPLFDKLNTKVFGKGYSPSIAQMADGLFLEIHVEYSLINSDYLGFQLMDLTQDGSITLKASGSV